MRGNGQQAVKAVGKAVQGFTGQAKDQIHMQVGVGVCQQPTQVGLGRGVVLAARHGVLHRHIEGLHTHFQLQHARRKQCQLRFQAVWQVVGDDFKMQKQVSFGRSSWAGRSRRVSLRWTTWGLCRVRRLGQFVQKKLQDAHRMLDLQIERAVDKLEAAGTALVQALQRRQHAVKLKAPSGFVERTEAKLALERAATRGFHIQQAVRQVGIRIFVIRQRQLGQRRLLAGDDFHQGRWPVQQGAAQLGKAHVAPAGDDKVGQLADRLLI